MPTALRFAAFAYSIVGSVIATLTSAMAASIAPIPGIAFGVVWGVEDAVLCIVFGVIGGLVAARLCPDPTKEDDDA